MTMEEQMRFAGKAALVTGGGGGLGGAFARAFATEGAHVAVADIDDALATAVAATVGAADSDALAVHCNVADPRAVAAAVDQVVDRFGRLDILVNSAGLLRGKYNRPFIEQPADDLRAMFDVNVIGIVNCARACRLPMVEAGGGAIVNLSSAAGHVASTPYGVTKLAVRGVTVALAAELAPDNIRVNALSPGFIASAGSLEDRTAEELRAIAKTSGLAVAPELLDRFSHAELVTLVRGTQFIARDGTVDDVVEALFFLCSDAAGFITGETVKIAGGAAVSF